MVFILSIGCENMVGRNDPCPCGSGKKYKKCCAGESEVSVQELVDEELEQIMENAFSQDWSFADTAEFERSQKEWEKLLGDELEEGRLLELISEYFIFVARQDLWKRYLIKLINSPIRSSVKSVLEQWQDPVVLAARIIDSTEETIIVEEILGNEQFQLEKRQHMPTGTGAVVLGVVLRDNRKWANGVHVISGLMLIEDSGGAFENDLMALAQSSGIENSTAFYKAHLVDVYHLLNKKRDINEIDDLIEEDLTVLQQQAVSIFEDAIAKEDVSVEAQESLKNMLTMYLLTEQPGFRKPEILAAATFSVAMEIGLFEEVFYTQVDIAELFGVSVASMRKQAEGLSDYAFEALDGEMEAEPIIHYTVGTDPLITEFPNWKMFCRMSDNDFDTFEEAQAFMTQTMNKPFNPKDYKQKAQVMAYEAYDATTEQERYRLAEQVLKQDPTNVDGLLLKAAATAVQKEKQKLYQSAMKQGELLFDQDEEMDNPWRLVTNRPYMRAIFAYGVELYEQWAYVEAAHVFEKLLTMNPEDNQGARYLAISSFVHARNYDKAIEILMTYEEDSEYDAVYACLEWFIEIHANGEVSDDSMMLLIIALELNPYVKMMLDTKPPAMSYPKAMSIASGSVEEAQYIWKLIH